MPLLPPERPKCSKRFGQPRNHSVLRLSPPAPPRPAGESSIPPKEAESKDQEHPDKRPDVPEHNREGRTNWTTWIIGACLAGALIACRNSRKQKVLRRWWQARRLNFLRISPPMLSSWRFPLIPLLRSKLNTATNMATDGKMLSTTKWSSEASLPN